MRKKIIILSIIFAVLVLVSCDAPNPTGWKGNYQKLTDIYKIGSGEVGQLSAEADPNDITAADTRVVITATVSNVVGYALQGVDVTFTTDTGFFRSSEFGPSQIFTAVSDSYGNAYAHLLSVGRTCTVKIEAGDLVTTVVITVNITAP
ncbi:MAG: hypothetical protein JW737_09835 [Acidobacteria bacterium]|nr:hypothetical protein [Acidobacteriota bacterium]